jgi:hypothetical protein
MVAFALAVSAPYLFSCTPAAPVVPAEAPSVAACRDAPRTNNCSAPFDTPPQLVDQPQARGSGPSATTVVWMLVDTNGVVQTTRIARSADSLSNDLKAVEIAKTLRFVPGRVAGGPAPGWIALPITTAVTPSCTRVMSVPLSAAGRFVDSTVLESPEMGMQYRYESAVADARMSLFIYPKGSWATPEQQGRDFVASLADMHARSEITAFDVVEGGALTVEQDGPVGQDTREFKGYRILFSTEQGGETRWSFFAVFPFRDNYLRFRVGASSRAAVSRAAAAFIDQMLSAMARYPTNCSLASRTPRTSRRPTRPLGSARCPAPGGNRTGITRDSVGSLPLRAKLQDLLALCPSAGSHYSKPHGGTWEEVMTFPFEDVYAYATQHSLELAEDLPPSEWKFIGRGGRLPEGLGLQARWGELMDAYGEVRVISRSRLLVAQFCRFPWMRFHIDPWEAPGLPTDGYADPARIPPETRIFSVSAIVSEEDQRATDLCGVP